MARAQLTEGVIAGSALVTVTAGAADGTAVLVHSGNVLLGQTMLLAGRASCALGRQLVAGEVLLASLVQQGQSCGIPVIVSQTGIVINGWRTPIEISVTNTLTGETLNLTAAQFRDLYGYLPPSVEDPAGLDPRLWPEYVPPGDESIQFDLLLDRTAGQTVATVGDVLGIRGGVLVSWNGSGYSNTLTQTFTVAQSITVRVKGSANGEAEAAERTVTVTIQPAAPTGSGVGSSPDSRIGGVIWRDMGNNYVLTEINADTDVEVRLNQNDSWRPSISYAIQYWECAFVPVQAGVYNAQVRIAGETNSSKWKLWSFTKP